VVGYSSGQRGQTVNLLANAYEGSNPSPTTTFLRKSDESGVPDTVLTQKTPDSGEEIVSKWPVKVKHRQRTLAKIYRPCQGRSSYRLTWTAAGRRQMKSFAHYTGPDGAKQYAKTLVKELAKGSQASALSPGQASDALAGLELLQAFYQATTKRVSLRQVCAEHCEAARKLHGRPLSEAVDGFMANIVTVERKDLAEAVAEFNAARDKKAATLDRAGRSQLSPVYVRNTARWLKEFADTFTGMAVSDITRDHLELYLGHFDDLMPKSRNDRRNALKMFFKWAVSRDWLGVSHRLFQGDAMKPEDNTPGETQCYTAAELRTLLENADDEMRAVIALQGLAGLRLQEVLRLTWENVFKIPGHIEVSIGTSKTRSRRLVEICPALQQWLMPYRGRTGKVWTRTPSTQGAINALARYRESLDIPSKKNGLRHGFVSAHFALHQNENATAAQAGHSPTVVHSCYKGLLTRKQAQAWFAVRPAKSAKNIITLPQKGAAK